MTMPLSTEIIEIIISFIKTDNDLKKVPKKYEYIAKTQIKQRKLLRDRKTKENELLWKHKLMINTFINNNYVDGMFQFGHIEHPIKMIRIKNCPTYYIWTLYIIFNEEKNECDLFIDGIKGDGSGDEWDLINCNLNKVLSKYDNEIKIYQMEVIKTVI